MCFIGCPLKIGEKAYVLLCFRSKPDNRTFTDNRHDFAGTTEQRQNFPRTALPPGSKRLSLALAASPRLARSHARTKRNDFPVGLTPQPPMNTIQKCTYVKSNKHKKTAFGSHRPSHYTQNGIAHNYVIFVVSPRL